MERQPIPKRSLVHGLRRAVRQSPLCPAAICRAAGIHDAALSRFLSAGTGLSVRSLDRLADVLELQLRARPKRR